MSWPIILRLLRSLIAKTRLTDTDRRRYGGGQPFINRPWKSCKTHYFADNGHKPIIVILMLQCGQPLLFYHMHHRDQRPHSATVSPAPISPDWRGPGFGKTFLFCRWVKGSDKFICCRAVRLRFDSMICLRNWENWSPLFWKVAIGEESGFVFHLLVIVLEKRPVIDIWKN